eukprot:gene5037-6138_t
MSPQKNIVIRQEKEKFGDNLERVQSGRLGTLCHLLREGDECFGSAYDVIDTDNFLVVTLQYLNMIEDEHDKALEAGIVKKISRNPNDRVVVFVRKRPLSAKETKAKEFDVLTPIADPDWGGRMVLHEPRKTVDLTKYVQNHPFDFDRVFSETAENAQVYAAAVAPLMTRLRDFSGTTATVFAYGQTGSGKTHTISSFYHQVRKPPFFACTNKSTGSKAAQDIFEVAAQRGNTTVVARFFEIYGGKCFDLMAGRQRVEPREDASGQVCLNGLTEWRASSTGDVERMIQAGLKYRATGATSANEQSSRSHSIFELMLVAPPKGKRQERGPVEGRLALIDLAGSERGADRGNASSKTRQEGAEINKSLLALKECIRALYSNAAQHVPFRGSRLTHIMRDAFIGKHSRTVLLAMVAPGATSAEHTLNTLRYAIRIKIKDQ